MNLILQMMFQSTEFPLFGALQDILLNSWLPERVFESVIVWSCVCCSVKNGKGCACAVKKQFRQ